MEVRLHRSGDAFRAVAEPLYRRDPVVHTIELTLLGADRFGDDSLRLTVWDNNVPIDAALQIPPYPLACNGIPVGISGLVATQPTRIRPGLGGVRGRREQAMAFADVWRSVTGRTGTVTTQEGSTAWGLCNRRPTSIPWP